jgi:hypothetical protein
MKLAMQYLQVKRILETSEKEVKTKIWFDIGLSTSSNHYKKLTWMPRTLQKYRFIQCRFFLENSDFWLIKA